LEIDPDQIVKDVNANDVNDRSFSAAVGSGNNNLATQLTGDDRDLRRNRPPEVPSRRPTVRLAVEPEQMIAFEAWRMSQLGIENDHDKGGDYEEEFDSEGDSSSRMDWTMDTTIVSCAERVTDVNDGHLLSEQAKSLLSSAKHSPPKQPRRRSTIVVTLSHSSAGNLVCNDGEEEDISESGRAEGRLMLGTASQCSLLDDSFSESSVDTSVFIEIFSRQLELAQRQEATRPTVAGGSRSGGHRGSRRRRSRASLKLRVRTNRLKNFMRMPQLDRIESVGTVLDEDDDRVVTRLVTAPQVASVSDTPENSARPPSLADWTDTPTGEALGVVPTRKKASIDTTPVAPIRAPSSDESIGSTRAHGHLRRNDPVLDQRPIQPCRRATVRVPQHHQADEINPGSPSEGAADEDDATSGIGGEAGNGRTVMANNRVGSVDNEKELRTSIGTVATEASWDSEVENDDASVAPLLQCRRANGSQASPTFAFAAAYGAPSSSLLIDEDE
jgi:hypothetical protein